MMDYGKQTVQAVLDKDSRGNYIQVSTIESKMWSMDIRTMYTDCNGELKPTTKGIRVNEELIVDLLMECIKALPEDLRDDLEVRLADEEGED